MLAPSRLRRAAVLAAPLWVAGLALGQSCNSYTLTDITDQMQVGQKSYLVVAVSSSPVPVGWLKEQVDIELNCQSYGALDPVMDGIQIPPPGSGYVPGVPEFRGYVRGAIALAGKNPCQYDRILVFGSSSLWKWPFQSTLPRPGGNPVGAIGRIDHQMLFTHLPPFGEPLPPHQVCGLPLFSGSPNPYPLFFTGVHETGHTFGWDHAQFWYVCIGGSTPLSAGAEIEYGDEYDPMGDQYHTGYNGLWGGAEPPPMALLNCVNPTWPQAQPLPNQGRQFHHYNPWYKTRAGWLDFVPNQVLDLNELGSGPIDVCLRGMDWPLVTESCERGIGPYHAVRVRRDADSDYWIYWRNYEVVTNPGQPGSSNHAGGPVISLAQRTNTGRAILIDTHPGDPAQSKPYANAPLQVGESFNDPGVGGGSGFTVTHVAAGDSLSVVRFTNVPAQGPPPPVIGLSNSPGYVEGVVGSLPDTVVYQATWTASAYDPAGAPIASVEMWVVPWSTGFSLRAGSTTLFPRGKVCVSNPACMTVPATIPANAIGGSGLLTSAPYTWQAGAAPNTIETVQGRYFLIVQATTAATANLPARTNVVWWCHTVGHIGDQ